jgi:hypothetical protein
MVAASATAILNDINLSTFAPDAPFGAVKSSGKPAKRQLPAHS